MTNIVNRNHPIKIYLVANDRKHRLSSMMAPTFFAGLVVFSSSAIFSNIAPNFILHIVLLLFLSIFMFSGNVLFFSPVVDYKVKIKPQNIADQYAKSIAVFELFMKKGVNLYQDVTTPAELSRDGQVHTTQTKEDFDQIYDVEKARKVYNEID